MKDIVAIYFPKMAATFPVPLVFQNFASPHQEVGSMRLPLTLGRSLWLPPWPQCGRCDTAWLPKLGHEWRYGFCLVLSLGDFTLGTQPLWGKTGHMGRLMWRETEVPNPQPQLSSQLTAEPASQPSDRVLRSNSPQRTAPVSGAEASLLPLALPKLQIHEQN